MTRRTRIFMTTMDEQMKTGQVPGYTRGSKAMRLAVNPLTRTHGYVALGFLLVFSGFTLFLVCQPKNHDGLANIVVTTLATATGPMVGVQRQP